MTSVAPATPSAPRPFPSKLNRRRYTRVPTRQMRSCYLAHGIGPADGWVVDISLGGVFLRSSWALPIGERLAIELPVGGPASTVCVRGRVVSSSPSGSARCGMGVRFDALDALTLTALRELVSSLAPVGTRLELKVEDVEITAVAPVPHGSPGASAPRIATPLPRLTAATPTPMPLAQPSVPRPPVRELSGVIEHERLRNHAKGLLMQVGELQTELAVKDRTIAELRQAVAHLQSSNAQLRNAR